jgi:hypothetical protein
MQRQRRIHRSLGCQGDQRTAYYWESVTQHDTGCGQRQLLAAKTRGGNRWYQSLVLRSCVVPGRKNQYHRKIPGC